MKFSIITPTYKRAELLQRAIESVKAQTHTDWEMLVVNDNPGDETKELVVTYSDDRIGYFEQPANAGVNATRNLALNAIDSQSDFIVLLDDDDYLTPDALTTMMKLIGEKQSDWLVTTLSETNGKRITISKYEERSYHYFRDYLLLRRLNGDATHCFSSRYVNGDMAHVRFPAIRQGEEWLFFAALGRYTKLYFVDVVTKQIDGYMETGLNYRKRGVWEQLRLIPTFIREGCQRGLLFSPLFWIYIKLRILRALVK